MRIEVPNLQGLGKDELASRCVAPAQGLAHTSHLIHAIKHWSHLLFFSYATLFRNMILNSM